MNSNFLLYNPDDFKNIEIKPDTTREEIEALRAENARLRDDAGHYAVDANKLRAENARLREALRPFAVTEYMITRWYGTDEEPIVDDDTRVFSSQITVGDLRAARAALGEEK